MKITLQQLMSRGVASAALLLTTLLPVSAAHAALTVEAITAPNFVVDSNVLTPATYAPNSAMIGAKFCNTDLTTPLTNVQMYVGDYNGGTGDTPGVYPKRYSNVPAFTAQHGHLANTGYYSLTHEGGSAGSSDAFRYIASLAPGECQAQYWLVSYPNTSNDEKGTTSLLAEEKSVTGNSGPADDLWLQYDIWAKADSVATVFVTRKATMRSEISASANKIWPNGDNKVPLEYKEAIDAHLGWNTATSTGTSAVYPGDTATAQGVWYDFGVIGAGFDNNGDLVPDHNAWAQPIGDAKSYDPGCFRLVSTEAYVLVKRQDGSIDVFDYKDRLYFENMPDNTGAVGLVFYHFTALDGKCTAALSPYQEVASGYDNEKFNGDYGVGTPPLQSIEPSGNLPITKNGPATVTVPALAGGWSEMTYAISYQNNRTAPSGSTGLVLSVGDPATGSPLVVRDTVPAGTYYKIGTAVWGTIPQSGGVNIYTPGAILFSTDGGVTWSTTQPADVSPADGYADAADVRIQWWLASVLPSTADKGDFSVNVEFKAGVPYGYSGSSVISNTGELAIGTGPAINEATDTTLVSGPNKLSGTVFVDSGSGAGGIKADGLQNGTELGIGDSDSDTNSVVLELWFDYNNNRVVDAQDVKWPATVSSCAGGIDCDNADGDNNTATGIDNKGYYNFTNLPDGKFLVKVQDPSDSDISHSLAAGVGAATTTGNEILVDLDSAHASSAGVNVLKQDFGFLQPLTVNKSLSSPEPLKEGDLVSYQIDVANNLAPPACTPDATGHCQYTIWAAATSSTNWTDVGETYLQAQGAPDGVYARNDFNQGNFAGIVSDTFGLQNDGGTITKVEVVVKFKMEGAVTDDYAAFTVNGANQTDFTSAEMNACTSGCLLTRDVTSLKTWSAAVDFTGIPGGVELAVDNQKKNALDSASAYANIDAIGFRVTTSATPDSRSGVYDPATTINKIIVTDAYQSDYFELVSSQPAWSSTSNLGGSPAQSTVTWTEKEIGSLDAGETKHINVTFRVKALSQDYLESEIPADYRPNTVTTSNVQFVNGKLGNTPSDTEKTDLQNSAKISGYFWLDADGDGWQGGAGGTGWEAGEAKLSGVEVELWTCMKDGVPLYPGNTSKECSGSGSNGGTWTKVDTQYTDENGHYEFLGLPNGYYTVEPVNLGTTIGLSRGQSADPNTKAALVFPATCNTINCDEKWYNHATVGNLDTFGTNVIASSLTDISNISFGFKPTGPIFSGQVWENADKTDGGGDGHIDAGEHGLGGVTVKLYASDGTTLVATTVTDSEGNYRFNQDSSNNPLSLASTYIIKVDRATLPAGSTWSSTLPDGSAESDGVTDSAISVSAGGSLLVGANDFGYHRSGTSTISGTLYYDALGNGTWDEDSNGTWTAADDETFGAGEPVTVNLYREDGFLIASAITDANGYYHFDNLPDGSYYVAVDQTDSDFPTYYNAGTSSQVKLTQSGDPDEALGTCLTCDSKTATISVVAATTTNYSKYNFGYQAPGDGAISGTLFYDTDGDGKWDEDTSGTWNYGDDANGIANITVTLQWDPDNDGVYTTFTTTVTDADGKYTFSNLPYGADAGSDYKYRIVVSTDDTEFPVNTANEPYLKTTTLAQQSIDVTLTASNKTIVEKNYGYAGLGAIGDTIYMDANKDGEQDTLEPGIQGVTVSLWTWNDVDLNGKWDGETLTNTNRTDTTDVDGRYLFDGLSAGYYLVKVDTTTLPGGGLTLIGDPDSDGVPCNGTNGTKFCDNQHGAKVTSTYYLGADFGYEAKNVLGDTLWLDVNKDGKDYYDLDGDGLRDAGEPLEPRLVGVTVKLCEDIGTVGTYEAGTDTPCISVDTDADGMYLFSGTDLANGKNYVVVVDSADLSGMVSTYDRDSGTASPNNEAFISNWTLGSSILDANFGFRYNGDSKVAGTVCFETDGSGYCGTDAPTQGVTGSTDSPYAKISVNLFIWNDDGDGIVGAGENTYAGSTYTDSYGNYSFENLPDNRRYVVSVTSPTQNLQLNTTEATLGAAIVSDVQATSGGGFVGSILLNPPSPGNVITGIDFAFKDAFAYDYGDAPSSYGTFRDDDGPRHIVPTTPNLYIGSALSSAQMIEADGNPSVNAGADSSDNGITPVGTWTEGVNGGSVTVNVTGSGWLVAWFDFDGDGTFSGAGEMIISQAVSTGNIDINFNIPEGTFDVSQGYARFRLFPEEPAVPELAYKGTAINGEVEDIQFPLPAAKSVIGDRVWLDENGDGKQDAGEDGIPNATVTLRSCGSNGTCGDGDDPVDVITTTTDANGEYLFKGVLAGKWTVSVTPPAGLQPTYDENGIVTTPNTTIITVGSGVEYMTADFGYNWVAPTTTTAPGAGATGAIGDRIWSDADSDGVQDPGEPGLSGVKVALLKDLNGDGVYGGAGDGVDTNSDGIYGGVGDTGAVTATTDSAGNYIFTGITITAGSYVVAVDSSTLPSSTTWTQTGDPDVIGQCVIGTSCDGKTTAPVILAPGDVYLQGDFGYKPASSGSVTGTVYRDVNADACALAGGDTVCDDTGDNVLNVGDTGISGVTVVLKDSIGNIIATTVTDSSGNYTFSGVPNGTYTVAVTDSRNVLGEVVQSGDPDSILNNKTEVTVSSATPLSNVNFGYTPEGHAAGEGMIGSTVFLDRDGDNSFDSGEGLEGVTVSLYRDGVMVAVTQTNENGQYQFGNLSAGSYEVRVKTATLPNDGVGLTNSVYPLGGGDSKSLVTLTAGSQELTQNFGYVGTNTVSGTIWNDANADGKLTDGTDGTIDETGGGLVGVTVVLLDSAGNIVATTTTGTDGNYSFGNLPNGDYIVHVTDEAGKFTGWWHSVGPNANADNNSQVSGGYSVNVTGGQTNSTADFGYYKDSTSFGGTLWNDTDNDGTLDDGETKLVHYPVELTITYPTNGATTTLTTMTDANGDYRFDNVMLDENYNPVTGLPIYNVTVPGIDGMVSTHTPTTDGLNDDVDPVVGAGDGKADDPAGETVTGLVKGETDITRDFGFIGGATIGDRVWLDVNDDGIQSLNEPGLSGVTVKIYRDDGNGTFESGTDTLIGTPIVTDSNGNYSFAGLPPGNYWVDVDETKLPSGLTATTPNVVTTGSNDNVDSDLDAGATGSSMITVTAGQIVDHLDFGYVGTKPLIGDTIWFDVDNDGIQDAGEAGLGGVTVTITKKIDNSLVATVTTDAAGHYLVPVDAGDYIVTVTPLSGMVISNSGLPSTSITVPANADILSADFGLKLISGTGYTIGDLIWEDSDGDGVKDGSENGIAGVTVDLYRDDIPVATTTTDATGAYHFSVAQDGTYQVRVTDRNNVLENKTHTSGTANTDNNSQAMPLTITLSGGSSVNYADFGYQEQSLSIGDRVWLDVDGNGVQDTNEPGMNGVTVELYLDGGSTPIRTETTGSDGLYNFSGLSAGKYVVKIADSNFTTGALKDFTAAPVDVDSDDYDSDGNVTTHTAAVTLGASSISNTDFGFTAPTGGRSVSGLVWLDSNKDTSSSGETGIDSVTVTLYLDQNGDGKLDSGDQALKTTTTSGTGTSNYLFDNLPDGKYLVEISGSSLEGLYLTTPSIPVLPVIINSGVADGSKNFGLAPVGSTYALISSFAAYVNGDGQTVLEWKTDSEVGTIGFVLERLNKKTGEYEVVSDMLPGMLNPPLGGSYRYVDAAATPGKEFSYQVREVTANEQGSVAGPFTVKAEQALPVSKAMVADNAAAGFSRMQQSVTLDQLDRSTMKQQAVQLLATEQKKKTGNIIKLPVAKDGLVYLTAEQLAVASGLKKLQVIQYLQAKKCLVTLQGKTVPALFAANGAALWFYGQAPARNDIGRNAYWLELGKKGATISVAPQAAGEGQVSTEESFADRVKTEENRMSLQAYINKSVKDFWAWEYLLASGKEVSVTHPVVTPDLAGSGAAEVVINLVNISAKNSGTAAPYKVALLWNGTDIGTVETTTTGDWQIKKAIPVSSLHENNEIKIVSQLNSGVSYSFIYLDSIEVTYQRKYQAQQGGLTFTSSQANQVTIEGFNGNAVLALDVTEPNKPVRMRPELKQSQAGGYAVTVPTKPAHKYFVTENVSPAAEGLTADTPSNLRSTTNQADYLIISPLHLLESAKRLADYRQSQGLAAMVVDIEDIQDEFSHGLAAPEAVHDFLAHVYAKWTKVPHYVVLVGDGSYDYRNYLGAGWPLVPSVLVATPEGFFPSDNALADVIADDGVPEFAVGRIPVFDKTKLEQYIDKVISYEQNIPASGRTLAVVNDKLDLMAGNFKASADKVAAFMPKSFAVSQFNVDMLGESGTIGKINDTMQQGGGILHYVGHSSLVSYGRRGTLLTAKGIDSMSNIGAPMLMVSMSCSTASFGNPALKSIGESALLRANGAAVGFFGATGLSKNYLADIIAEGFYRNLATHRIGDAVLQSKQHYLKVKQGNDTYIPDIYNLLGDPAMQMTVQQ